MVDGSVAAKTAACTCDDRNFVLHSPNSFVCHKCSLGFESYAELLKRLSDELFTFLPERLSVFWIERISAHSLAYGADGHVVRHDMGNVAVLAISAADLVS